MRSVRTRLMISINYKKIGFRKYIQCNQSNACMYFSDNSEFTGSRVSSLHFQLMATTSASVLPCHCPRSLARSPGRSQVFWPRASVWLVSWCHDDVHQAFVSLWLLVCPSPWPSAGHYHFCSKVRRWNDNYEMSSEFTLYIYRNSTTQYN